jgi:hypothetical protein
MSDEQQEPISSSLITHHSSLGMRQAVVVIFAATALCGVQVVKLAQLGGPYFARPATVLEHMVPWNYHDRRLLMLAPAIANVIPRGATVSVFEPVDGKAVDDSCFFIATGQLPRHRIVPFSEAPEWVVAVGHPLRDPHYELIATYPEGLLYTRKP